MSTKVKSDDGLFSRMRRMFTDPSELTVAELLAEDRAPDTTKYETRKSPRQLQFREAQITLAHSGEKLSVAVKDLSAGGVKIESFRKFALPSTVEFYEPLSGRRTQARVAWQEDYRAALEFID